MKKLLQRVRNSRPAMLALALFFIAILAVGMFFLGDKHGIETMTFRRVTPDQLATAMLDDHFYSSYRENTLLVSGTVSSVSRTNNDLVVTFKTTSSFKVLCDFGGSSSAIRPGDVITALSEGGSAKREISSVLLKDCLIP